MDDEISRNLAARLVLQWSSDFWRIIVPNIHVFHRFSTTYPLIISVFFLHQRVTHWNRYSSPADSRLAPSQWQTSLQSNAVSHWLGANLESSLYTGPNLQHCCVCRCVHYSDVITSAMATQIAGVSIVFSTVCSGADQRKHQSPASLAFVMRIHRWPMDSPHKGPVTRKVFTFDDAIMPAPWGTLLTEKLDS